MSETQAAAAKAGFAGSRAASGGDFVARVFQTLCTWQQRARDRATLAGLDDRMLQDIGISRSEAARECSKQFWQA